MFFLFSFLEKGKIWKWRILDYCKLNKGSIRFFGKRRKILYILILFILRNYFWKFPPFLKIIFAEFRIYKFFNISLQKFENSSLLLQIITAFHIYLLIIFR